MTLACPGFNRKNTYDRQTPCDQDFLRQFARDTEGEREMMGSIGRFLWLTACGGNGTVDGESMASLRSSIPQPLKDHVGA